MNTKGMPSPALTEEDVRRIFREELCAYETKLNVWMYQRQVENLTDFPAAYQGFIDAELNDNPPDNHDSSDKDDIPD